MDGFLAVSCGPQSPSTLRQPVTAALACLADARVSVDRVEVADNGWVAFASTVRAGASGALPSPPGAFTTALGKVFRSADGDCAPDAVAALVSSASPDLARLLPPFALVHRTRPQAPILAAVDWLGLFQLYLWQGSGVAAISTSARALAVLAGGDLDDQGLRIQAMVGWQLADATMFDRVRAVPAASVVSLDEGTVSVREYVEPLSFASWSTRPPLLADAVDEMAAILRVWLDNYVSAHPDALLQLTGGHDSRILLGAIPTPRRRGLRALTLGDEGSRDVAIASDLCRRYGMVHQVHRIDEQVWPSPAGVHDLVMASARALECMASPLALTPLLLAEADIDQGYRLSGLGGEVARGFYYGGQPKGASTSAALVARLAHWRLCSNEAVATAALDEQFLAEARAETTSVLTGLFAPGDWLRATDEFYLYQRMRRWAGTHGTVATMRRQSVNAMFDRRFIELALAVAPGDKRDSLLLGRLMSQLDRELAAIPLDIGVIPSQLGQRTLRTKAVVGALAGRRTLRKAWQRVTSGRRPQAGAGTAAALLLQHWRAVPSVCDPLFGVGFLRRDWLQGVLTGAHDAQPTTLAFLANVLAAIAPVEVENAQRSLS